jgi:uncharacterized membrane protein
MNLTKRLEEARQAFLKKENVKASLRIQDPNQIALAMEKHGSLSSQFIIAILLSALSLFNLGAAKVFITQRSPVHSGLEMLIVGGLAAGVAYFVGVLLKPLDG